MKSIAFIYKDNISQRYANVLSLLKNIEATIAQGYTTNLLVPKRNWKKTTAQKHLFKACEFYHINKTFPISLIPSTSNFFGRSFGILAAFKSKFLSPTLIWSRDIYGTYTSAKLNLNVIFEHHTALSPKAQKLIKKIQNKKAFKGIIAISQAHKELLISYGLRSDKIFVAHSGIDQWVIDFQNNNEDKDHKSEKKTVLYAGSFYEGRGIETIIEIAKLCPDYDFVCIGGTPEQMEQYSKLSDSLTNLKLIPKLPRVDLLPYLKEADVLIAPYTQNSRSISGDNIAAYQSPLKLIEYMAVGKPIVTSQQGAIPEIIINQYNGLLVEPDNVNGFQQAVQSVLENESLATKLAENARTEAEKYTWNKRVANILEFAMQ